MVFALVIYSMLSSHRLRKEPLTRRFQRGLKASFVLLPLLGISWSFGVLTMTSDKITFNYIFAIFNSLQGFFIFIFHCVFNKQVRFRVCLYTKNVVKRSVEIMFAYSCFNMIHSNEENIYMLFTATNVLCESNFCVEI